MRCYCHIIPPRVLERLARDKSLSAAERKTFADAAKFEAHWRDVRAAHALMTAASRSLPAARGAIAPAPSVTVYDCANTRTLPGALVAKPRTSGDPTAKRAFDETTAVAKFYREVFGRNSVDGAGMTLMSSIHYGVKYNNAFWNGTQMTYGDGDGNIFVDFTRSNDVIGHELTHGVTEYSAQFAYSNEAGGLNESMSDVFGSMFRQWRAKQTAAKADWLIGRDIMGPGALKKGYTCLRDMANPAAKHCLSPQPTHFSQYRNGMDPHESSGIPNLAFQKAAMAIGGKSWEKAGKVWYEALTAAPAAPNMKMKAFANRTRSAASKLFPADVAVAKAVDSAWKAVGL